MSSGSRRPLRYLLCGDRRWDDWSLVRRVVEALAPGATVILGDSPSGLDAMAIRVLTRNHPPRARAVRVHGEHGTARASGGSRAGDLDVVVYRADWDGHEPAEPGRGNPAGMIRNRRMLLDGQPDRLIYFANDLAATRSTRHLVRLAETLGVPVMAAQDFLEFVRRPDERIEDWSDSPDEGT